MAASRGYEPVALDMMGVEKNGDKDAFMQHQLPYWRNNLTALSQYHNLYFVAAQDKILVYQPLFPFQRLGNGPRLKLTPPLANPHAPGHLSRSRPHIINRLLVGNLGDEEILLLCTDSGNVAAYQTSSIQRALDTNHSRFNRAGVIDDGGARAFFSQAVQRSAWGLAIHKAARMIAISSNAFRHDTSVLDWESSAKVTIFAFALSGKGLATANDQEDEGSEWISSGSEWVTPRVDFDSRRRARNYEIVLGGCQHNIPNISFINTGDDPHGNWLFSTDIMCNLNVWHVWDQGPPQSWPIPGDSERIEETEHFYGGMMGWSVLGLDTSSFRRTASFGEFCGSDLLHCDGTFVNITGLRPPELKPKGILGIAKTPQHTDRDDQMSLGEPDVELSEDEEGIGEGVSLVHEYNSRPYLELSQEELDVGEDAFNAAQDGEDEPRESSFVEVTGSAELTTFEAENAVLSPLQPFSAEPTNPLASHSLSDPGMISDDEEEESDHSLSSAVVGEEVNMDDDNRPYEIETHSDADMNDSDVADDSADHQDTVKPTVSNEAGDSQGIATSGKGKYDIPSIPILYASDTSIHLITLSPEFYESARCLDPLYVKRGILSAHGMNRINMTEYIRELGVVVIATQIGRVGILSMTTHPTSNRPGFRMDWILPSRNREHGEEPTQSALHGIAVSPIQGHALESDSSISSEGRSPESEEFDASSCFVDGVRRTFDSKFILLSDSACSSLDNKSRVVAQADHRRRRLDSESSETAKAVSGRRYRLMVYYNDHTVLTYEIGGQGQ